MFNLSEDDAQKMISDAVFYFLVADQKKAIIKRPDLIKNCDLTKKEKRLQDYIIAQASRNLLDTFGIEVQELSKTSQYILTNKLTENGDGKHLQWSEKESAQMGITFVLLGLILMSNDKVTDEILFKFLKNLGLGDDEKTKQSRNVNVIDPEVAELFDGDIKKFVNETLVAKQHYLKRERVQTVDQETEVYEYSWGERAEKEVKPSSVFKMVCEVYGCDAKEFKEQMDRIKERENLDDDFFTS